MSAATPTPLPPPLTVDTAVCTGEIHDHGAQVTAWAPRGSRPVLWLSRLANLAEGTSIRGGIPVCWPWFGPGRGAGFAPPAHGFVRVAPWERVSEEAIGAGDDAAVVITHRIDESTATAPQWPFPYAAHLRCTFGRDLLVELTVTNTGSEAFDFEEALHAYLVVGDVQRATLDGLDGKSFWDKVTGSEGEQVGPLRFAGETDSVFRTADPVVLTDPVLGRRITVSTSGGANVVVWNPWSEKVTAVADIADDEWTGFVCIEGANAFENAVALEPGESHTLGYRLEVEDLP